MPAPDPLAHLPAPGAARVLVDGLDHPEGVCWDPIAGCLYAGGEDGQIYRVELDGGDARVVARAPGQVLGVTVDGAGCVLACASRDGSLCVWDPRGGDDVARPVLREVEGEPFVQPNFCAFGPDGTLYLSDSGTWARDDGRLIALAPDGAARVLSRDVGHFTNGLAVSPDGRRLWCVESFDPVLTVFDLAAGQPRAEVVRRFEGTVLDGLAPTAGGGLLVTCYRPDRIYHLDASGTATVVAQDPQGTLLGAPTNAAFAGPDLDVAVVANLGRWHLTTLDLGLRGAPLHRPERWAFSADPART
jgi:sugar lactone lactonase YvrE